MEIPIIFSGIQDECRPLPPIQKKWSIKHKNYGCTMHARLQDLHRDGYMENVINYRLWKRIHIILLLRQLNMTIESVRCPYFL